MPVLTVRHVTTYRYRHPVGFGEHRAMLRPRDSSDQRLLDFALTVSPEPSRLRHLHDPFGNVVSVMSFQQRAKVLSVESVFRVDHSPRVPVPDDLAPYARQWPFSYEAEAVPDLQRLIERQYPDPGHAVDHWLRGMLIHDPQPCPLRLLATINDEIRRACSYAARHEEGTQDPARTLALRNGTCRDFAVLMMEAARALGFAARFVSGYLYVPSTGGQPAHQGGGSTHAWAEVYLPGAGWVEFDPTNSIVGTRDLIRVASVRDPDQAVPLSGSWTGFPADSEGMTVSVSVTSEEISGHDASKEAEAPSYYARGTA